jgi:hypothetical protein
MCSETNKIQLAIDDDRNHTGATIISWGSDAVDHRILHLGPRTDRVSDFTCRDVFALPAKRVSNPIDEVEESCGISPHQIAASEPRVTRREDVAQNLPVRSHAVGVPVELGLRRRRSLASDLA